jgi:RNA polymerase sigma-70 factor, ECF subfamily
MADNQLHFEKYEESRAPTFGIDDTCREWVRQPLLQLHPGVREQMLVSVPKLRAFALSLSGNPDQADDPVQQTLLRALTHIESFEPGTNMVAWLFTILHNEFRSQYRKGQREVEDIEGRYAETLKSHPDQIGRIEFKELREALTKLPSDQREALVLVAASAFSYSDAAALCGCAVGTIKSRINRARVQLADLLSVSNLQDFGPDGTTLGVLAVRRS